MNILLAITFVYGIIRLISFTKVFDKQLIGILETAFTEMNPKKWLGVFIIYLDYLFFYFSLVFQAYYWLFK